MTARRASSRAAIAAVARALGGERVVFVGGTVVSLYPLEGGVDVRETIDVDCVVDVASTADYYAFVHRLHALGFRECTDEGAPLCRMVHGTIRVDIVATVDLPVGPTNRWYRDAVTDAASYTVDAGLDVLGITPVYFIATKLEAFRGRGGGDFQASHDLEDALAVMAGLPALRDQIAHESTKVSVATRRDLVELRAKEAFIDAVPGHFDGDAAGQARADSVLAWLAALVA